MIQILGIIISVFLVFLYSCSGAKTGGVEYFCDKKLLTDISTRGNRCKEGVLGYKDKQLCEINCLSENEKQIDISNIDMFLETAKSLNINLPFDSEFIEKVKSNSDIISDFISSGKQTFVQNYLMYPEMVADMLKKKNIDFAFHSCYLRELLYDVDLNIIEDYANEADVSERIKSEILEIDVTKGLIVDTDDNDWLQFLCNMYKWIGYEDIDTNYISQRFKDKTGDKNINAINDIIKESDKELIIINVYERVIDIMNIDLYIDGHATFLFVNKNKKEMSYFNSNIISYLLDNFINRYFSKIAADIGYNYYTAYNIPEINNNSPTFLQCTNSDKYYGSLDEYCQSWAAMMAMMYLINQYNNTENILLFVSNFQEDSRLLLILYQMYVYENLSDDLIEIFSNEYQNILTMIYEIKENIKYCEDFILTNYNRYRSQYLHVHGVQITKILNHLVDVLMKQNSHSDHKYQVALISGQMDNFSKVHDFIVRFKEVLDNIDDSFGFNKMKLLLDQMEELKDNLNLPKYIKDDYVFKKAVEKGKFEKDQCVIL